jgi:hypothetical protein
MFSRGRLVITGTVVDSAGDHQDQKLTFLRRTAEKFVEKFRTAVHSGTRQINTQAPLIRNAHADEANSLLTRVT